MSDTERDPSQWSPCHDRRGVPICAGDLIRSPHFIDGRRKQHYLYHVAVSEAGFWYMVPTSHLQASKICGGGRCMLSQSLVEDAEVISGYGPSGYLDHLERPRAERSMIE